MEMRGFRYFDQVALFSFIHIFTFVFMIWFCFDFELFYHIVEVDLQLCCVVKNELKLSRPYLYLPIAQISDVCPKPNLCC